MADGPGAGWDDYASTKQAGRNRPRDIDGHLGRQLNQPPSHLSRVLYIPHHQGATSHLSIYDISSRYATVTGSLPIGSSQYLVALGTMQKPRGDGGDDIPVAYNVEFSGLSDGNGVMASIHQRALPAEQPVEAQMSVGSTDEAACVLAIKNPAQSDPKATMRISYPIPPSETRTGKVPHPYFAFALGQKSHTTSYQWQIHPIEDGRLRYTLVRTEGNGDGDTSSASEVDAIYHHIGLGAGLSLPYSEGVLLLPPSGSPETEALVLASTLGMLWHLRKLHGDGKEGMKGESKGKQRRGFVKNLLKRKD